MASKLRLPDEAARFLVDATPARRADTRKNQTHPGQASLFVEPPKAKPKKQISSLSEAAVQRFLAEDPSWADQHPPGSLFWRDSQTYVVPLWHPRVPVEDSPSRLERIRKRAGPLAGGNAGERFAVLERVRQRFPAAQKRLVEPALAHELARAELIVRELEEAEAASQPAAVFDFSEVRDWLDAFERETRYSLPRYQNYPVAPGPLTERWQRMETSAAYLDHLSAAIKASPAMMWTIPVELTPLQPQRRQKGMERAKLPQAPLSLTLHSYL